MKIKEILSDSLKYPISDWKKFLIFGIFSVLGGININYYFSILSTTNVTIPLLEIINFIFIILIMGYFLKIMKSSINNANKAPKFDHWKIMFIDGIKVSIVNIIYLIPVILIAIVFLAINPLNIVPIIKIIEFYPNNVFSMLYDMLWYLKTGFVVLMLLYTYMIIIYPFINIAVAHMAYNDSKLKTAFKFREILHKISTIGWKNFILWYILIKILFLTISYAGSFILFYAAVILRNGFGIHIAPIMPILTFLIIAPYLSMYFVRSVALFYMSGDV